MIIDAGKAGISGRFRISKSMGDADGNPIPGTEEVISPWFDNLITDTGLDNVAERRFMDYCSVGSGSTEPMVTDISLSNKVATSNMASLSDGPAGVDYSSAIGTYTFPQGTAQGNLSEIGVSRENDGTNLTSRALILDGNGSPTTIVVEDIAILTVTYEWRLYIDTTDRLADIMVGGILRSTVTRESDRLSSNAYYASYYGGLGGAPNPGYVYSYTGDLGPAGGMPSGSVGGASGSTSPTYVDGSHSSDITATWDTTSGNGLIKSLAMSNGNSSNKSRIRMQTSFDPPLEKDKTKTMSITWRRSWGRK